MLKEFKEFALRGNVLDLAVGVIIGGAFGNIVTSLVNDIFTPIIGYFTAGADFTTLKYTIAEAVVENGEVVKEAVAIHYGNFIQNIFNFVTIAFCVFLFIKLINKIKVKPAPAEEPKEEPIPEEILLLRDIKELLKKDASKQ